MKGATTLVVEKDIEALSYATKVASPLGVLILIVLFLIGATTLVVDNA